MRKKHLAKFRSYAAVSPFGHNCLAFWVTTNCLCVCVCARVCVCICACVCVSAGALLSGSWRFIARPLALALWAFESVIKQMALKRRQAQAQFMP